MTRNKLVFAVLGGLMLGCSAYGVELWNNGPLVTHPGGGFGGNDLSMLQSTSLGLNILGYGHQVAATNRVADNFTVPAGPGWNVDTITFFAYQTNGGIPSTITAVNFQIWDGVPHAPGSSVIFGDEVTNRMATTSFSGIYRASETTPLSSARAIMENVTTAGTTLAAGTYWLDWQTDGSAASGPWAPPVSILGMLGKPGADGLQSTTPGAWAPLLDGAAPGTPQDLPFIINGTVVPAPGALALLGLGGLLAARRRRR